MPKAVVVWLMLASMIGTSSVAATNSEVAELKAKVADLQAQVDALRQASGENWLTEQRAAEIRGLVQDVLADADARASLLQSGITAGYDRGFFLASADGNYRLKISGLLQIRLVYSYQDVAAPTVDQHRWGLENRRTRLDFAGNVVNPNWIYHIHADFARGGETADVDGVPTIINRGAFSLLDAYIGHRFENGVLVRAGQFKAPFNREQLMSDSRLLPLDRTMVDGFFAVGRTQGIELQAPIGDKLRLFIMYNEGARQLNTAWQEYGTEWAFTGRAEYLVAGTAAQFTDFSSWSGDGFALLLGAAGHAQSQEYGPPTPSPKIRDYRWTFDATAKLTGGIALFAAVHGRHTDGTGVAGLDQFGALVQAGFFVVPDEWEVFGRYEWGDADMLGVDDLSVVTVGFNRYWAKHNLKWTSDVGYGINAVQAPWATTGLGWRTDPADADGQIVVRSQLQLAF